MKATKFTLVLLALFMASLIPALGQQAKDKKKQEEDAKKKSEQVVIVIDSAVNTNTQIEMLKAMSEALVAQEKALKAKRQIGVLDDKEFFDQAQSLQDSKRKFQEKISQGQYNSPFSYSYTPPKRWKSDNNGMVNVYGVYNPDHENTSLNISKSLEDITFSTDFYYDVKSGSSTVSFFVSGTLKAGELKITMKKPDKTAFQEFTISPLADVDWNQQFKWEDNEVDQYQGKWMISITATKASGNYRIQVNSR